MKILEPEHYPACLTVDLAAVRKNVRRLRQYADGAELLAVVKSNGYGFGRTEVALAAHDEGVHWFAVSRIPEALSLRASFTDAGISPDESRILTWIGAPDEDWVLAVENDLDVSVSITEQLSQAVDAVRKLGGTKRARIHLNVDVGMSRGGANEAELPELGARIKEAIRRGEVELVGLLAHLPQADDPYGVGAEVTKAQIERFKGYELLVREAGLYPQLRHLGASAGTIWHPDSHFDMVRPGIGLYGLSPNPEVASSPELGLTPIGRLTTTITQVKLVEPGTKVSYGGTWEADVPRWIGLLPVGYADGIPRALSNRAPVEVLTSSGPLHMQIVGRVCMDQIMIDLGSDPEPPAAVGDTVVLFGDPAKGEPSIDVWAKEGGTINYEIASALPEHLVRVYVDSERDR